MVVKIHDLADAYQSAMKGESVLLTKSQALTDCQSLLNIFKDTLAKGACISFHGLGSIVVKKRNARKTKLPNGDEVDVTEAISCSMVKVIRKSQVKLFSDKKVLSSCIKDTLAKTLNSKTKSDVLYSVFQRFLSCVRNGRYSAFYLHKFGRFTLRASNDGFAIKFSPSSDLKDSLQSLL